MIWLLLALVLALAAVGAVFLVVLSEGEAVGHADADPTAFIDFEAQFQADLRRAS